MGNLVLMLSWLGCLERPPVFKKIGLSLLSSFTLSRDSMLNQLNFMMLIQFSSVSQP